MHRQGSGSNLAPTSSPIIIIVMEGPTEEDEASVSTENVGEGPNTDLNTNDTIKVRRKAATRTLP
jgi:hypothetical protein